MPVSLEVTIWVINEILACGWQMACIPIWPVQEVWGTLLLSRYLLEVIIMELVNSIGVIPSCVFVLLEEVAIVLRTFTWCETHNVKGEKPRI